MRRFSAALAAVLLAAASLVANSQAPASISTVVIATDPDGRPVTDLRADEFQVFDDDVPQRVSAFHVAANGQLRDALTPGAPVGDSGRTVVVFIDDMHIRPTDTPLARQTLRQIRDVVLAPDDLVAVVSTGFSSMEQDLRRDPTRVRFDELIQRMTGSADSGGPATTFPAAVVDRFNYHALVALRTARDVVGRLGGGGPGLKAVIYVSGGYPVDLEAGDRFARAQTTYTQPGGLLDPPVNPGRTRTEADVIAAVAHLTAEARRANATFYPIDPVGAPRGPDLTLRMSADDWRRSLETQRSALRTLSQTTGGICICGTNDINPPLRRVASETANYYLVSFRPDGQNPDRPRHRVRIATTRSGVILRYAADYFSAPR